MIRVTYSNGSHEIVPDDARLAVDVILGESVPDVPLDRISVKSREYAEFHGYGEHGVGWAALWSEMDGGGDIPVPLVRVSDLRGKSAMLLRGARGIEKWYRVGVESWEDEAVRLRAELGTLDSHLNRRRIEIVGLRREVASLEGSERAADETIAALNAEIARLREALARAGGCQ